MKGSNGHWFYLFRFLHLLRWFFFLLRAHRVYDPLKVRLSCHFCLKPTLNLRHWQRKFDFRPSEQHCRYIQPNQQLYYRLQMVGDQRQRWFAWVISHPLHCQAVHQVSWKFLLGRVRNSAWCNFHFAVKLRQCDVHRILILRLLHAHQRQRKGRLPYWVYERPWHLTYSSSSLKVRVIFTLHLWSDDSNFAVLIDVGSFRRNGLWKKCSAHEFSP